MARPSLAATIAATLGAITATLGAIAATPAAVAPTPAAVAASASRSAAPLDLDRLLGALARGAPRRARFVERHFVEVLDAPIDARGELRFEPPDRFEKLTTEPRPERVVIEGARVTIERPGLSRSVDVDTVPQAAAIVGGLRALLLGDRAALERQFDVALAGSESGWTMTLVPKDPRVAGVVARIEVAGDDTELRIVEVRQAGGDRSVMRVMRAD